MSPKFNIRFDMTARKKGSIQKKQKTKSEDIKNKEISMREKKELKFKSDLKKMNYYVSSEKIVLSSLYSFVTTYYY